MCVQATSSLDTATEQSVQQAIHGMGGKKTVVIIAHRLSTVQNADCILVLEHGRLVESGSHVQLLSNPNGRYRELISKLQQQHATVDQV